MSNRNSAGGLVAVSAAVLLVDEWAREWGIEFARSRPTIVLAIANGELPAQRMARGPIMLVDVADLRRWAEQRAASARAERRRDTVRERRPRVAV